MRCERCTAGDYAKHGPDVINDDQHRSIWEQFAWIAVEHALAEISVINYIASTNDMPTSQLVGPHLGYVVEARIVPGWQGCVDIYIPGLRLIIQVDGKHHDTDVHGQQQKDMRFMASAYKNKFHALRVSHMDDRSMHKEIHAMVHDCIASRDGAIISRLSKAHPLLMNPTYKPLV